jgi:hypothetical protein
VQIYEVIDSSIASTVVMSIYAFLGGGLMAQLFNPAGFNKLSDFVSPLYVLAVIAIIHYYRNLPPPKTGARIYEIPKKDAPWQDRFVGTWDKIDRPGFKEVST